jgi:galactitol-specific phosphotransferase system IIB component
MREGELMSSKAVKTKPPSQDMVQSAIRYFNKEGYKIEQENTALEGFSGVASKFDLIVQKGRVAQGVWIRDWNRTIGVNLVINIDKASEDVGLSNPIIIGEKFSDHAKSYANRRKITLLQKQKIAQSLR